MYAWLTIASLVIAVGTGIFGIGMGLAGKKPNDYVVGAAALVELALIVQLVVAIVAPALGNTSTGSVLEFYLYLVTALIIPPAAVFWALIERGRWSTVIIGAACLSIAIMIVRMQQIWYVQVA